MSEQVRRGGTRGCTAEKAKWANGPITNAEKAGCMANPNTMQSRQRLPCGLPKAVSMDTVQKSEPCGPLGTAKRPYVPAGNFPHIPLGQAAQGHPSQPEGQWVTEFVDPEGLIPGGCRASGSPLAPSWRWRQATASGLPLRHAPIG